MCPILKKIRKYEPRMDNKDNSHNINYNEVYNTKRWRGLRLQYLREHPLCEVCLLSGKLSPAKEAHHKIQLNTVQNIQAKKNLGFDYDNLQSLCPTHHKEEHRKRLKKLKYDKNW
jgi:HNH endonuclease